MFRRKPKEPQIEPAWMVVGLGNPGPQYAGTRHNVGFAVVDEIAKRAGVRLEHRKHQAAYAIATIDGTGVLLVKPMTYMNLSGRAVAPLAKQFGLKPEQIVVIADDLDLAVGRIVMKPKGGAGGHNGHKSIIHLLGTNEYPRIKIGIDKATKETIDHVLSRFKPDERANINLAIQKAANGVELLARDGLEKAITFVNS